LIPSHRWTSSRRKAECMYTPEWWPQKAVALNTDDWVCSVPQVDVSAEKLVHSVALARRRSEADNDKDDRL
jgi:hypothetical protein